MKTEQASCHCKNISAELELTGTLADYTPRACDCDFCTKHGAAYISDPKGRLSVRMTKPEQVATYKQGDGLVELLMCKVRGVLVAATYSESGKLSASVNSRTLENRSALKPAQAASPKQLSANEKVDRWQALWFADVHVHGGEA